MWSIHSVFGVRIRGRGWSGVRRGLLRRLHAAAPTTNGKGKIHNEGKQPQEAKGLKGKQQDNQSYCAHGAEQCSDVQTSVKIDVVDNDLKMLTEGEAFHITQTNVQ